MRKHYPAPSPCVADEGEAGEPGGSCTRNSGEVCRSHPREGAGADGPACGPFTTMPRCAAAAPAGCRTRWKSSGVAWASGGADWNSACRPTGCGAVISLEAGTGKHCVEAEEQQADRTAHQARLAARGSQCP